MVRFSPSRHPLDKAAESRKGDHTTDRRRKGGLVVPDGAENEQRLRAAGVLKEDPLPAEYTAFVEGLTPHEVDLMVAMRRRLDEAERVSGKPAFEVMFPP